MNIEELRKELQGNKIKNDAYLINPPVCIEGALCLKSEDGTWSVTFVERGEYFDMPPFFGTV